MTQESLFGKAKWVTPGAKWDTPYIRGTFTVPAVKKAVITICGLGFSELYINGEKAGRDFFTPLSSEYHYRHMDYGDEVFNEQLSFRVYCPRYDITSYLTEGLNTLCVMLAPGWYSGGEIRYGDVKLIYRIDLISIKDEVSELLSDTKLKWAKGPIIEYHLTTGEVHDDAFEHEGWMFTDFDDTLWESVKETSVPETEYYLQDSPADCIIRHIEPVLIKETGEKRIYDMGENITGYPVICSYTGKPETIVVRVSEEINPDNTLDEKFIHGQISVFHTDGKSKERHIMFTWNGFRYVEVSANALVTGCAVIHADIDVSSSFDSSDKTLNWLYDAYLRTQLTNMHCGIPSDCPHLERRGYTGDGQLTCETAMLMLDAKKFYEKWIRDISDCQDRKTGHIQYTAPFLRSGGGPGGWGCAIVEIPYIYYSNYGDKEILRELYPQMLNYFNYLEAHSEDHLITSDQPNRWCLGDWCMPGTGEIPPPYVNNYFYIKSMNRVLEIAKVLGIEQDNEHLNKRIKERKEAMIRNYYDPETGDFAGNIFGANAYAADLGIDLDTGDTRIFENIIKKYTELGGYDTGIFATDILTRILFERGYGDLAFTLLTSEGACSFHNWKKQNATTLWEYWDGTRSHSHPMFGAVVRYLFQYLLGIRQAPDSAAYEKVMITPCFLSRLPYVQGHITTAKGRIAVRINRNEIKIELENDMNAVFISGEQQIKLHKGINEISVK